MNRTVKARWKTILAKLEPYAALLARPGTLASRMAGHRRVWSVRFYEQRDGRRVQRAIFVGHDRRLVRRVQRLIDDYRVFPRLEREVSGLAKLAAADVKAAQKA